MQSDSVGARRFRERVLSREWRPEDQIVPVLNPQIGVTHELTRRNENASSTSRNWAGSSIKGPWGSAFGIWRVPTVSKPSIPAGSAGNWISTSWVGIDGVPPAANDVLQAGVKQEVTGDGDAFYSPWYEWYIPPELRIFGSPIYIFETPIGNMRIEPGDEVFCAIYYVGQGEERQGEILFGNMDRGHYFSIVLAPPNGASFNGDTAEWIMEAPNGGEPKTSLPNFTPVVFSTAFANGPSNTTGNPAEGDTTNIRLFDTIMTSVSLQQYAVEIDYIGSNWQHALPSDAAGAGMVMRGTNPTSWYTTPEYVQHIAYVGIDQRIQELFYRLDGSDNPWVHVVPSDATGAVAVAPGTSPTSWYTTPENVEHIAYVGIDQRIHELFFRIDGSSHPWVHVVPSDATGAVAVAPETSPTS